MNGVLNLLKLNKIPLEESSLSPSSNSLEFPASTTTSGGTVETTNTTFSSCCRDSLIKFATHLLHLTSTNHETTSSAKTPGNFFNSDNDGRSTSVSFPSSSPNGLYDDLMLSPSLTSESVTSFSPSPLVSSPSLADSSGSSSSSGGMNSWFSNVLFQFNSLQSISSQSMNDSIVHTSVYQDHPHPAIMSALTSSSGSSSAASLFNETNLSDLYNMSIGYINGTEGLESGSDGDIESYENFLIGSRFWVQRVLVPLIMVIGIIGNSITIVIMTRRRMRSSTNNYLAALATFDMLYLIFTFILSFARYPNSNDPKYYYYWKLWPFSLMIADCCSNSSVWLTVTFTIERYIVVSHPIKGKIICTESRSRKVVLCVLLICFTYTLPTPFEWLIIEKLDPATNLTILAPTLSDLGENEIYKSIYYWLTAALFVFVPLFLLAIFNSFLIRSVHISRRQRNDMTQSSGGTTSSSKGGNPHPATPTSADRAERGTSGASSLNVTNGRSGEPKNSSGTSPAHPMSGSACVSGSASPGKTRGGGDTTHVQQSSSGGTSSSSSSSKQETKITIMLIAVVILFFVCQLPTAFMLILTSTYEPPRGSRDYYVIRGLNNIFNFLVAINAAGNFLLYCLFSQRYRRTFVNVFCPCYKDIKDNKNKNHTVMALNHMMHTNQSSHPNTTLRQTSASSSYSSAAAARNKLLRQTSRQTTLDINRVSNDEPDESSTLTTQFSKSGSPGYKGSDDDEKRGRTIESHQTYGSGSGRHISFSQQHGSDASGSGGCPKHKSPDGNRNISSSFSGNTGLDDSDGFIRDNIQVCVIETHRNPSSPSEVTFRDDQKL